MPVSVGEGHFPMYRTICNFRALHLNELAALLVKVNLAHECGLIKLGLYGSQDVLAGLIPARTQPSSRRQMADCRDQTRRRNACPRQQRHAFRFDLEHLAQILIREASALAAASHLIGWLAANSPSIPGTTTPRQSHP